MTVSDDQIKQWRETVEILRREGRPDETREEMLAVIEQLNVEPQARRRAMSKSVEWFARSGDIARMGPFASQALASAAIRLVTGGFHENAFVWPEECPPKGGKRK